MRQKKIITKRYSGGRVTRARQREIKIMNFYKRQTSTMIMIASAGNGFGFVLLFSLFLDNSSPSVDCSWNNMKEIRGQMNTKTANDEKERASRIQEKKMDFFT